MSTTKELQEQAVERFWETVPPVWNFVRSHIRDVATEKSDISVEQFHMLRHVRRGIVSVSNLANAKGISRPAISQAVDVLVKKGLLTRVQSTQDRRYVDLALTKEGAELLDTVFKENRAWMKERMTVLTKDELETIASAMVSLKKILDAGK